MCEFLSRYENIFRGVLEFENIELEVEDAGIIKFKTHARLRYPYTCEDTDPEFISSGSNPGPFSTPGVELFGNLTVLVGIRDLRCVQDMNCYDASPATVDTVFYSDSHTVAENGKHFLENDGLVEFRGVGLPCFTGRPLEAPTVCNRFVRPRVSALNK